MFHFNWKLNYILFWMYFTPTFLLWLRTDLIFRWFNEFLAFTFDIFIARKILILGCFSILNAKICRTTPQTRSTRSETLQRLLQILGKKWFHSLCYVTEQSFIPNATREIFIHSKVDVIARFTHMLRNIMLWYSSTHVCNFWIHLPLYLGNFPFSSFDNLD